MTEKHLIMNVFKCISCHYRTTNRDNYRIHGETKHSNDELTTTIKNKDASEPITHVATCPFCNQELCDLSKLMQHIESVHCKTISSSSDNHESICIVGTETCFKCKKCNFFGSKNEIEKHNDSDHGDLFKCQQCGIVFKDDVELSEHKESHDTRSIPLRVLQSSFCKLSPITKTLKSPPDTLNSPK